MIATPTVFVLGAGASAPFFEWKGTKRWLATSYQWTLVFSSDHATPVLTVVSNCSRDTGLTM